MSLLPPDALSDATHALNNPLLLMPNAHLKEIYE